MSRCERWTAERCFRLQMPQCAVDRIRMRPRPDSKARLKSAKNEELTDVLWSQLPINPHELVSHALVKQLLENTVDSLLDRFAPGIRDLFDVEVFWFHIIRLIS
jgi:hypothetical protein